MSHASFARYRWLLLVIGVLLLAAGCTKSSAPAVTTKSHLVIIVPGTYSNDDFWPNVVPGQVTFGSELQQALGAGGKVHPFLWASSLRHENRLEAAENLAALIDEQAGKYDCISLVGHSHGGNVALLAAGLCHSPLESVVCLATPHAYLRTKGINDSRFALPVYCSPQSLKNCHSIVSVVAATDAVPDVWATDIFVGMRENTAAKLTDDWQAYLDQPRLADDSLVSRLFQQSNVATARDLNVAHHNLQLASQADDLLGLTAHSQIHSRRMGRLIGELLRDGNLAIEPLSRTVIPADADEGEPVVPNVHANWLAKHQFELTDAGWLLRQAKINIEDRNGLSGDLDRSLPDPVLRICCGPTSKTCLETKASNSRFLHCSTPAFVPRGLTWSLNVHDHDLPGSELLGDRSSDLGSVVFTKDAVPPNAISAHRDSNLHWSGTFIWAKAHY